MAWARTLGVIAVVAAVIALAGGFGEAIHARRSAAVGVSVDNGRRLWVVRRAELTTTARMGHDIEPSLRVTFTITNTDRTSDPFISQGVVTLVLADGAVLHELVWRSYPRSLGLFPDIPAEAYIETPIEPALVAAGTVTVRIHDEIPHLSPITTDTWQVAADATDVVTPVHDVRNEP